MGHSKTWLFSEFILIVVAVLIPAGVYATSGTGAPPELEHWRQWVLYGKQDRFCPPDFDKGNVTRCRWPSRLSLMVDEQGGKFDQQWRLFAPGWVQLPGSRQMWPEGVQVNGQTVAVVERREAPSIFLKPGSFRVSGRFEWDRLPEMIRVPASLGLVSLVVGGKTIIHPVIDSQHNLWIKRRSPEESLKPGRVEVKVVRLVQDTIPMVIVTILKLEVSGPARKFVLEPILPRKAIPMTLESGLPARLDSSGRIELQLRPGSWQIRLKARMPGPVKKLSPPDLPYGQEIWAFEARSDLRSVKVEGAPLVEPSRTSLPAQWRRFPAYLISRATTLIFKQIRRGAAEPEPDRLELERDWWLDFNGGGFTIHDRVSGILSRQWYLTMNPPATLGRVAVKGKDRLITAHGPEGRPGVELRRGRLDLAADARIEARPVSQPVTLWDHDFNKVRGRLHLPPGWRLAAAFGIDNPPATWLGRWTRIDFFLVLIIAMAVFKLAGLRWAVLALVTMTLIYHEPSAPRLVWLHLLVAMAVKKKIDSGFFHRLAKLWFYGAACILAVQATVFTVSQLRTGFFPQLAPVTGHGGGYGMLKPAGEMVAEKTASMMDRTAVALKSKLVKGQAENLPRGEDLDRYDPDALIQTGPGLPDWSWLTLDFSWNGPVAKDQSMRLLLLSPVVNCGLSLLRVILLAWFVWVVVRPGKTWGSISRGLAPTAGLLILLALAGPARAAQATLFDQQFGFPPAHLLQELEKRLLTIPDCFPRCADLARMDISLRENRLQLLLQIHGAIDTAVALPAGRKQWMPRQVLADGAQLEALGCDDRGQLWAVIPAGRHTLALLGDVSGLESVRLPLPLKPHRVTVTAPGWTVDGLGPQGQASGALVLHRRMKSGPKAAKNGNKEVLTPFFSVEKKLRLGLDWKLITTVNRLTPAGQPVVLKIPLLAGQAVTSSYVGVENGQAVVRMGPGQHRLTFDSVLEKRKELILNAPREVAWTETWILEASPIWHCNFRGLVPVRHKDPERVWRPVWRPWPGEQVSIAVSRPKAVTGRTITIDRAGLTLRPSSRYMEAGLNLEVRSSKGGQYTVELPEKAFLRSVRKNGRSLPAVQDGKLVVIPLEPGSQSLGIDWRQPHGWKLLFRGPHVSLGQEAVNAQILLKMPANRWILWLGGPRLGPAILFWSYLGACLIVALVLARTGLTPLGPGQWMLLVLGLVQVPVAASAIVAGWLLALGLRRLKYPERGAFKFDLIQLSLVALTCVALAILYWSVKQDLMAPPRMFVAGNGSSDLLLRWYQDRIGGTMPMPIVLSLPRWTYQILMMLWSLWLVTALVGWLKWGWNCFTTAGTWRKLNIHWRRKRAD